MNRFSFIRKAENRLDVVAGLIDGILNALALASGRLVREGGVGVSSDLAIRISTVAGLTTIFVFFVAHYAELRLQLIRFEKELNFTEHGRLAQTRLGRQVMLESLIKALIASFFSFTGALFPLLICVLLPSHPSISLALSIVALGVLGALLAKAFYGSSIVWSVILMIGGACLAVVGVALDIAGG